MHKHAYLPKFAYTNEHVRSRLSHLASGLWLVFPVLFKKNYPAHFYAVRCSFVQEWKILKGSNFGHRTSKLWLAEADPKSICKELIKHNRSEVSLVIALLSGHNATKEHLERSRNLDQDITMECRLCENERETNEQLLDCQELRLERVLSFGTSDKEQIKKHWKVSNIIEFCSKEKVKSILKTIWASILVM